MENSLKKIRSLSSRTHARTHAHTHTYTPTHKKQHKHAHAEAQHTYRLTQTQTLKHTHTQEGEYYPGCVDHYQDLIRVQTTQHVCASVCVCVCVCVRESYCNNNSLIGISVCYFVILGLFLKPRSFLTLIKKVDFPVCFYDKCVIYLFCDITSQHDFKGCDITSPQHV